MTPTQRSLKHLREQGYVVEVVERWNPHSKTRHDLYGFADLVAIRSSEKGVMAIQTTSGSNVAARLTKIRNEPKAGIWLAAGNRIFVHGWRKTGPKGKRKVWTLREIRADFTVESEVGE